MALPAEHDIAPAFATAPDIVDPSGAIAGWWTRPPGLLLQLTQPVRGTTMMSQWLVGPAYQALLQRFPATDGLRIILDMRRMTGRSATARALLVQRAKPMSRRIGHVVLIPSTRMGAAYVKVVETTVSLLRAAGVHIELEQDFDAALSRHGVRPLQASGQQPAVDPSTRR